MGIFCLLGHINSKLHLYMYYNHDVIDDEGERITTYFVVISYDQTKNEWVEDGTYEGTAVLAELGGSGSVNKKTLMIDPTTWIATAKVIAE